MRLYRFMNARNGLRSLRERRLRIGRVEELNDDFELLGQALAQKDARISMRKLRREIDRQFGVLCMGKKRDCPQMWAHYGDSHKGMVLAFDVPTDDFFEVHYVEDRPRDSEFALPGSGEIQQVDVMDLARTKSNGWIYEAEYRAVLPLVNGVEIDKKIHYFLPFSDRLRLRQVMVGSRFQRRRAFVEKAVADREVEIFQARGSFHDFRVVRQENDRLWR